MTSSHLTPAFPDPLLASSVNGGGVFVIAGGKINRISPVDTTGIAVAPGAMVWARQAAGAAELRRVAGEQLDSVVLTEEPLDLHDLLWHDDRLYVVATQTNTIFELDAISYKEHRRWTLPGQTDSHHLNSVCFHEGRVLASRFGNFERHREYKGRTRGAGQVIDIDSGDVLIDGLSQPHSLTSMGGLLWLCNSEAHSVHVYRNFVLQHQIEVGGYARGLAFGASRLYVGISRSRNEETEPKSDACIASFDLEFFQPMQRIAFPANEIYDLVVRDDMLRSLRSAGLQDALEEGDRLRHARNQSAMHAHQLRLERDHARSERDASLTDCRSLEQRLAAAIAAASNAAHRAGEDQHWIDLQQDALVRIQTAATQLTTALAISKATRLSVETRLATVTDSRSWRWTRWLRGQPPHQENGSSHAAAPAEADGLLARTRRHAADDHKPEIENMLALPTRAMVPILGLAFAEHANPTVSIVVAAYGKFAQTLACLQSIARAGDAATFEVIIVEDGSGEIEMRRFAQVPGLRYVENPKNLGYLRTVNSASALARGEYLHLLNNDTEVTPGWLDALLSTFAIFGDCGLAGSRLVYPDGRLQEAGGIVWSDGNACNYGRGDDPSLERYAVVREVDYVSGASLLLRKDRFVELGGFDERYLPAYYEDTDLAFRVRAQGGKVYVQPSSMVVHHEGLSHGTDITTGIKASQARNREVFVERWRGTLEREQMRPGEHVFLARERSQLARIILLIDRFPPQPDRDAGSRAIWQLMRVLHLHGWRIKFWSHETGQDGRYTADLRMHGIDALDAETDGPFAEWIAANGCYLDAVLLSRPIVAQAYMASLRDYLDVPIIYYGHDIHFLRIRGQLAITGDPELRAQLHAHADSLEHIEHVLWRQADLVLYPSADETALVEEYLRTVDTHCNAMTVPLFAYEDVVGPAAAQDNDIARRQELLFVGGFAHLPNADGVAWFLREVWPHVRCKMPGLALRLVGADPTEEIRNSGDPDVHVAGHLSEAELVAAYAGARVVIAPLRFGAGTKGKVIEAMRHGVPCVTTAVGAQGLSDATHLGVVDDPEAMASMIIALASDEDSWAAASRAGIEYVRTRFSVQCVWSVLGSSLAAQPYDDVSSRLMALQERASNATCRTAQVAGPIGAKPD